MKKISNARIITVIAFIISLIVGMYLLIGGIYSLSRSNHDSMYDIYKFFTQLGAIIIVLTVISGIYVYLKSPPKLEVKKDYINLKWLNHQYYELGGSLQEIASDQGVSMMTIKKWVDKLDRISKDIGAK